MTNAEKYLKDETKEEFECKLAEFMVKKYDIEYNKDNIFIEFLNAPVQPTLTEDERVILRNIDKRFYTKIFRNECLFLWGEHTSDLVFTQYDHLFQFIKNGEEYSIEELLK